MVMISDPVGDMLIRIKNVYMAEGTNLTVPHSKEKEAIAKVLVDKKYLSAYEVKSEGFKKELLLTLSSDRAEAMEVKRISKPGRRVYVKNGKYPAVKGGKGTLLVSTSKGIMDASAARKLKIGGELLAEIF